MARACLDLVGLAVAGPWWSLCVTVAATYQLLHFPPKKWASSWLPFPPRRLAGEQRSPTGNQDGLEAREAMGVLELN